MNIEVAMVGEEDAAELTTWLVPTGSLVESGQPIAEVTSSKVVMEVTAPVAGRLRHLVEAGVSVGVGQTIAVIE